MTSSKDFLKSHIVGDRTLTNLNVLTELLPTDPDELRALHDHCLTAALDASQAGRHIEARRLGDIARQLKKRADLKPNA